MTGPDPAPRPAPRPSVRPSPPAWVRDTVFYQVFPDRFAASPRVPKPGALEPWDAPPTNRGFKGGDLLGLAERLDDLLDLGITGLYLNPVFAAASNHRYNAYDFERVDPLLGGDGALRELLDAAHARGMRVLLDGVFNHVGRGFWPFHHVLEVGGASPYRDWFHLDEAVASGQRRLRAYPEVHEDDDAFFATATGRATWSGYDAWWGIPSLPKLRVEHPGVRAYLLGIAERWLRFGADGWRLDVPADITDPTFWPAFRARCRDVRPDAYLVGEIWHEAPEWLAGDRFDALMAYPVGLAILGYAGGDAIDHGAIAGQREYAVGVRPADGATFGRTIARLFAGDAAVTEAQFTLIGSHDTPRARTVLGGDERRLRLAQLLHLVLPGAPCLYYGDELGMVGGCDPDCRRGYPVAPDPAQLAHRAFVRDVIALRRREAALRHGRVAVAGAHGPGVALERVAGERTALVAVNPSAVAVEVSVADGSLPGSPLDATPAGVPTGSLEAGTAARATIRLPAFGALVLVDDR